MKSSSDAKTADVRKFRRRSFCSITMLAVWAIVFSLLLLSAANDVYAFVKPDVRVTVDVEQPFSAEELAQWLADRQIIRHPTLFVWYLRNRHQIETAEQYRGTLTLHASMSYRKILAELKKIPNA